MKPGRNDPCPCGSGKKYKKCCGAKQAAGRKKIDAAVISQNGPGLFQKVQQAGKLYQMNKEDAEKKKEEKKKEKEKPSKSDKPKPDEVAPPPTKKEDNS